MYYSLRNRTVSLSQLPAGTDRTMGDNEPQCSNNELMKILLDNNAGIQLMRDEMATMKAEMTEMKETQASLTTRMNDVDERVSDFDKAVLTGDGCIKNKLELTVKALRRAQIASIKNEYNSMSYNVIVHNVKEKITGTDARGNALTRESQTNSIQCAYEVIENVFGIEQASSKIPLVTAHRLPTTSGKRPPLIFKLAKLSDKEKLWNNISNVKTFNELLVDAHKVFVQMTQLPAKLAHDKASLLDAYKQARTDNKNPKWRYLKKSGQYCYVIGKQMYKPEVDYFLHEYTRPMINS